MDILAFLTSNYDFCGILVLFLVLSYILNKQQKTPKRNYPPGPKGWPIIGYLPFITRDPYEIVRKLGKQYGHVFMFRVGMQNVVILNSMEAVKDSVVRQGDLFTGKPLGFQLQSYGVEYVGIAAEEGNNWKEQRKFTSSTLREFGNGKLMLEEKILEECDAVKKEITKYGNKPFPMVKLLGKVITNVISSVVFGNRDEYDDPEFTKWMNTCYDVDVALLAFTAMDFFPLMDYLPKCLNGLNDVDKTVKLYHDYASKKINQQIKTYKENVRRSYVDCYLEEMHKRNKNGETDHVYDYHRLRMNVLDLIIAGTWTIAITLGWTIKYLLSNPDTLKKLVQEIDTVVGKGAPSWFHRANMPYTEAVLNEGQRAADILPLAVPRSNTEDAKILGYDIPKRSMVYQNITRMHHDSDLWGDPEKWRPERFIDEKTKECLKPENFFPFGKGNRMCPASIFGRMNLFIVLVSLLQNFTINFENPADAHRIPIGTSGVDRYVTEYNILAKCRTN